MKDTYEDMIWYIDMIYRAHEYELKSKSYTWDIFWKLNSISKRFLISSNRLLPESGKLLEDHFRLHRTGRNVASCSKMWWLDLWISRWEKKSLIHFLSKVRPNFLDSFYSKLSLKNSWELSLSSSPWFTSNAWNDLPLTFSNTPINSF